MAPPSRPEQIVAALTEHPNAAVGEIARAVDVPPKTLRSVRARLANPQPLRRSPQQPLELSDVLPAPTRTERWHRIRARTWAVAPVWLSTELVAGLRDIVSTLADADPEDKAELYRELGITLTYSPDGRVNVQVLPRGVNVRVGGPTHTLRTRPIPRSAVIRLAA